VMSKRRFFEFSDGSVISVRMGRIRLVTERQRKNEQRYSCFEYVDGVDPLGGHLLPDVKPSQ